MLPVYGFVWNAEAYEMWSWTWTTVEPWKFGWHSFISEGYTPGLSGLRRRIGELLDRAASPGT